MGKTKTYSIARLKAGLSSILAEVAGGGEVLITDHNRPVARIVPTSDIPPLPKKVDRSFLKEPRIRLKPGSVDSATLVRQMRDEDY